MKPMLIFLPLNTLFFSKALGSSNSTPLSQKTYLVLLLLLLLLLLLCMFSERKKKKKKVKNNLLLPPLVSYSYLLLPLLVMKSKHLC